MNICKALPMPNSAIFRKPKKIRPNHSLHSQILPPMTTIKTSPSTSRAPILIDDIKPIVIQMSYPYLLLRSELHFDEIPPLNLAPPPLIPSLLNQKIELCSQNCDFSNSSFEVEAKKIKADTLNELLSYISFCELNQDQIQSLFKMIKANLSRLIPHIPQIHSAFVEEPLISDPAWKHLSLVYSILNKIINKTTQIDTDFLKFMATMLKSPHKAEREKVTAFFATCCVRFVNMQDYIQSVLNGYLVQYLEQGTYFFSISTILHLVFMMIQWNPLDSFRFYHVILPLVNMPNLRLFMNPLKQILGFFLKSNPEDSLKITEYVLKHFPFSNSFRQPQYLQILFFLVRYCTPEQFKTIVKRFASVLAISIDSFSVSVCEAALTVFSSSTITFFFSQNLDVIIPIVTPPLVRCGTSNWNLSLQNSAISALTILQNMNPLAFKEYSQPKPLGYDIYEKQHTTWTIIARTAADSDSQLNLSSHLTKINQTFRTCIYNHFGPHD